MMDARLVDFRARFDGSRGYKIPVTLGQALIKSAMSRGITSRSSHCRAVGERPSLAGPLCYWFAGCAMILAAGCASMGLSGTEGLAPEPRFLSMFVVSTRQGESGASSDTAAEEGTRFSLQMVSVPPSHEAGVIERPAFGSEDPDKHFAVKSWRAL